MGFVARRRPARQPQPTIDALVAQKVAHEVLGHAGQRRTLSLSVTAGFVAVGIAVPGLGLLDLLVNPLVVRAFTREQHDTADFFLARCLGRLERRLTGSRMLWSFARACLIDICPIQPSATSRFFVTTSIVSQ